ncbi:hypothetical protein PYCCODRAFT_1440928 [Trametes coccinea BRFM310]|uniref:ABM domain-containing protein n=1 Tax=Trametes coccinea (strain BRFM310) TaxID=1353009 RepID=A0A1Y2I638_TRAC3|nr:hypothetical protein PYCCODRAFT_1440928 [Trametes coccinea BRFM310]
MSIPTIEVVWKRATDAFCANPKDAELVKPAFDILSAQKGQLQKYFGIQHEDQATAYAVIAWQELEDHLRLMNDKETYPRLGEATKTFFDPSASQSMVHVRPLSEPFKAFEAPVTEIAWFTLKDGQSKNDLEQRVDALMKAILAGGPSNGVVSGAWGPTVEKDSLIGLFLGWQSVEAHWEAVKDKTISDMIAQIQTIASVDLIHIPLTKW